MTLIIAYVNSNKRRQDLSRYLPSFPKIFAQSEGGATYLQVLLLLRLLNYGCFLILLKSLLSRPTTH